MIAPNLVRVKSLLEFEQLGSILVNLLSKRDKDELNVSPATAIALSFSSDESPIGETEAFFSSISSQFRYVASHE